MVRLTARMAATGTSSPSYSLFSLLEVLSRCILGPMAGFRASAPESGVPSVGSALSARRSTMGWWEAATAVWWYGAVVLVVCSNHPKLQHVEAARGGVAVHRRYRGGVAGPGLDGCALPALAGGDLALACPRCLSGTAGCVSQGGGLGSATSDARSGGL